MRETSTKVSRKTGDDRLTTVEISRLREQKRLHRHMVTAVIGLGLMAAGTAMYLSPHAEASDEITVYEMDDSNITSDAPEFSEANLAFSDLLAAQQQENANIPHPDFLSLSAADAAARSAAVSDDDLPEDGGYDPSVLLVDMASDTTQADAEALAARVGAPINQVMAEADGRFGASIVIGVPDGTDVLDLYRDILADPKVRSCGFNLYLDGASVQTDDTFVLNGGGDWSDGVQNLNADLNVTQLDDFSVFDDPEETYGDLNAETPATDAAAFLSTESLNALEIVNDSPESTNRWEYKHLNYEGVWSQTKVNRRITVGVIDTGVRADHRDLQNVIVDPIRITEEGGIATAAPVSQADMDDPKGHGTHVAGIIGAQANNNFGISGLSYNANIMPIQLPQKDNGKMSAAAAKAAFYYVAAGNNLTNAQKKNVRVINVSLGSAQSAKQAADFMKTISDPLSRLNDSGTLVVVAAGNQSGEAKVPYYSVPAYGASEIKNLLAVINLAPNETDVTAEPHRYLTSNYNVGNRHDCEISAPGTGIFSTYSQGDNTYTNMTGTSQAAPIVSATAALMFAVNPNLTPEQVKQIILETATDLGTTGWNADTGYGEINPVAAIAKVKETAPMDEAFDIGRKNSSTLSNLQLAINGQEFPAFSYDKVAYDLEYNGMRDTIMDTHFEWKNIPSGMQILRRISDLEYSDEMINASNGIRYREVSQVVTFLFAGANAQLTDNNALKGIYAFYIRYNVITGQGFGTEAVLDSEQGEQVTEVQAEQTSVIPALAGMVLLTGNDSSVSLEFDTELPNQTQYLRMKTREDVDALPHVAFLPLEYSATIESQGDAVDGELSISDDVLIPAAYSKTYDINVSNYVESFEYTVTLYCEATSTSISDSSSTASTTNTTSTNNTNSTDPGDIGRGEKVEDDASQSAQLIDTDWGTASETPTSEFKELKDAICYINNSKYKDFQYEKTTYVINFKLNSTLPPSPTLSLPAGWRPKGSSATLEKSAKYPYGGMLYSIEVSKGTLSRTYTFSYTYSATSSSSTSGTKSGSSSQTPTVSAQNDKKTPNQGATTPAASNSSAAVTTTYNEDDEQPQPTITVNSLSAPEATPVNAQNAGQPAAETAVVNETKVDSSTGKTIANTSPAAFVSNGTLTQTGDAAIVISGGVISVSSLAGIVIGRRRMKNAA